MTSSPQPASRTLVPAADAGALRPLFRPARLMVREVEALAQTLADRRERLRAIRRRTVARLREARAAISAQAEAAAVAARAREVALVAGLMHRFDDEVRRVRNETAAIAAELSIRLARDVLARELLTTPDALLHFIATALAEVPFARSYVVRLHPDDVAAIATPFETMRAQLVGAPAIELRASDSVARWDVRIDTPDMGSVKAGLSVALNRHRRALGIASEEA